MLKFEISEQMVMTIGQILGKAPYEAVAPILTEMQKQIDEQKRPAAQSVEPIEAQ